MATLINNIASEDAQTIFIVCGYGQSRTIPHYLYMSELAKREQMSSVTAYPQVYSSLMSKDTPEL